MNEGNKMKVDGEPAFGRKYELFWAGAVRSSGTGARSARAAPWGGGKGGGGSRR
ncbi:MAG: hypothetical protein GTN49_06400 [candidate division Zixibacteria bacterium]|nr:hypothetical protein [candidate division Zixibacteria bacterium]